MKFFAIFLVSLALVAYCESRVAGEAPANAVTLAELISQARQNIAKLGQELHKNLNLPDEATIVNTLKNHSSNLVTNLKTYVHEASDQLKSKSPDMEKLWNNMKQSFTQTADEIAANIPTATNQAAEIEEKFLKGVDAFVKQAGVFTQTLGEHSAQIREDVSKIAKKTVEMTVEATQQLNSGIAGLKIK